MKALVKVKPERGIWMEDIDLPSVGHNDVLIKIRRTAICGTDIHIFQWNDWAQATIPVPMNVGHEFCGEIVECGSEVRGFQIGDRVSAEGHITCGVCRNCRAGRRHLCMNTVGVGVNRPGAFAEYLSIPMTNVWYADPDIPAEQIACFDPLGNATHTALSFPVLGEDVLITGAGPIGIMAGAIAKKIGARHIVITDINPYRLDLARKIGLSHTVNVAETDLASVMKELAMREGFDVGLEMSGNPRALNDMLGAMIHGGKIALLGIPPAEATLDLTQVVFKGLTIKGIYGREMFETWYKMIALLQEGLDLTPIVTHRLDVDQFQDGFDVMRSGKSGKVVLDWS